MTISIPTSVFDKYHEGMDCILSSFGVNCTVYFPPLKTPCPNCYFVSIPGIEGTNIYRPDGPYPFLNKLCPLCEGTGSKLIEESKIVKMRAYFDKKSWDRIVPTIAIKDGSLMTIGKMANLIDIQRSAYITLPNQNTTANPYTLTGEPIPWGFGKDRYFTAIWQRGE